MFGSVLARLQDFMISKFGKEGWQSLLVQAGLPSDKEYRSVRSYPDEELERIIDAAIDRTQLPRNDLMRQLGKSFGDYLLDTYNKMFFSDWRSLDIIEKVAPKVFRIVQIADTEAPKSSVQCKRISRDEVVIHYRSPRQMCAYIMGIVDSTGEFFHENLQISHTLCMCKGNPECEIRVKLVGPKET